MIEAEALTSIQKGDGIPPENRRITADDAYALTGR
jgi:hypothetical protein